MTWARIGNRTLAEICYRVGTSLGAGVDIRRTLAREAERNAGATRRRMDFLRDQVASGTSLSDALQQTGTFFPRLLLSMVRIGESTGQLDQILLKLSEYFDHIVKARRQLMRSIVWPMLQLGITLFIVGVLIVLPEMLPRGANGQLQDLLGWGWVGYSGLMKYLAVLAVIAIVAAIFLENMRRETRFASVLLALCERIPYVGVPLTELALARVAWSLSLTTNTAMPVRDSIALALDASLLPRLRNIIPKVHQRISQGSELHTSLRETGQLPAEFLDVVEVGEETGNLPEALGRLSRSYDEQSRAAIQRLAVITGFLVWLAVAILIISLILQLYGNYARTLQGLV